MYEVTSEAVVRDFDCYVVKTGGGCEDYYRKADLAFVQGNNRGALEYTYTPPRAYAMWPLHVGRAWELSIAQERPQDGTTENIFKTWRVEAKERITVTAGTFDTYKIVERNKRDNSLSTEHWLAPEVKAILGTVLLFTEAGAATCIRRDANDRFQHFPTLAQCGAFCGDVKLVLDRRMTERRHAEASVAVERRSGERRATFEGEPVILHESTPDGPSPASRIAAVIDLRISNRNYANLGACDPMGVRSSSSGVGGVPSGC